MLTVGSLFAGIGGMDRGLKKAGMRIAWQVEIDEFCRRVLAKHFPEAERFADVRHMAAYALSRVSLVCGGDPCPFHSRARSNGPSKHPDLSGYFLAVVGRFCPEWVVRENVPAPTIAWFDAALAALGYESRVLRLDSAPLTGQSRQRDFIVAVHQTTGISIKELFSDCKNGAEPYTTRLGSRPVAPCLTAHRTRYDSRDCYIWEQGRGLRILDGDERDALAGFPVGWTTGFSEATRARMDGNAVVPAAAQWIGERIVEASTRKVPGNDPMPKPEPDNNEDAGR